MAALGHEEGPGERADDDAVLVEAPGLDRHDAGRRAAADSRVSVTNDSAYRVSPTNTGFGSRIWSQARLAIAFWVRSLTLMPVTNATVKVEFTSALL